MDIEKIAEFGIRAFMSMDTYAHSIQPEIVIHHKPCGVNINTHSNKVDCRALADYMLVHKCETGPVIT